MVAWLAVCAPAASAEETDGLMAKGKRLYAEQCQSCHGENGAGGTDSYSDPLTGDASIKELVSIIDETMPEGEPELCAGADAKAVANYIYQAFYSKAAQLRNHPTMARGLPLTLPQYPRRLPRKSVLPESKSLRNPV